MRDLTDSERACIARATHEVNRAYCRAIGDSTQVPWDDAPEWQRRSAIEGVLAALNGATPEQSHEGWMRHKLAEGWSYGPVKDPDKRTHPCLVPYASLPPSQRVKDDLFVATVQAMGRALFAS